MFVSQAQSIGSFVANNLPRPRFPLKESPDHCIAGSVAMTVMNALPQVPLLAATHHIPQCGMPFWVPVILMPSKLPYWPPIYFQAAACASAPYVSAASARQLAAANMADVAAQQPCSQPMVYLPSASAHQPYYCVVPTQPQPLIASHVISRYLPQAWETHQHMITQTSTDALDAGNGYAVVQQQTMNQAVQQQKHYQFDHGNLQPNGVMCLTATPTAEAAPAASGFQLDQDDVEYERLLGMKPLRLPGSSYASCEPLLGSVGLLRKPAIVEHGHGGLLLDVVQSILRQHNVPMDHHGAQSGSEETTGCDSEPESLGAAKPLYSIPGVSDAYHSGMCPHVPYGNLPPTELPATSETFEMEFYNSQATQCLTADTGDDGQCYYHVGEDGYDGCDVFDGQQHAPDPMVNGRHSVPTEIVISAGLTQTNGTPYSNSHVWNVFADNTSSNPKQEPQLCRRLSSASTNSTLSTYEAAPRRLGPAVQKASLQPSQKMC